MLVQLKNHALRGFAHAQEIAPDGRIIRRTNPLAVLLPSTCTGAANAGTLWHIEGDSTTHSFVRRGYRITQEVVRARSATLQRPSGELLAQWIAKNVPSIGVVIARRLVRAVPELDRRVREHDTTALCRVASMSESRAKSLIDHWPSEGLHEVITWLERAKLPLGIAERLCRVYGERALQILKDDPFYLMGFGIPLHTTLALANTLGLAADDRRIAAALAEHAAARVTSRTGSTVITKAELAAEIARSLGPPERDAARDGPEAAREVGALIEVPGGFQTIGHAMMEREIARFVHCAATRRPGSGSLLAAWERELSEARARAALDTCEQTLSLRLTDDQRDAVTTALRHPVALISGEAGTGKTTLIRAILAAYDRIAAMPTFLLALSGRAARRMSEATGHEALTIAKFIVDHHGDDKPALPEHLLLIIDEASMVDLLSAYRLVRVLPEAARLLFVGDEAQLPPVGPGSVFHALIESGLPVSRLSEVKRHDSDSEIYRVASALRRGIVPVFPRLQEAQVAQVSHSPNLSAEHVEQLWLQSGASDRTIILSPTRKGPGGVDGINMRLQGLMGHDRPMVTYLDPARGWIPWIGPKGERFYLHDRVMVTENDYEADVRNGDLGTITQVFDGPDSHGAGAAMEIEGRRIPLTVDVLSSLSLGYAVTVHKAQGSQWPVCILMLPSHAKHMTDRSLLYTAATRAREQLILCGDQTLLERGVAKLSRSTGRKTDLVRCLRTAREPLEPFEENT